MGTFEVPVYSLQIVCAQPRIYTIQLYFKLIYMQTHLTIQPHMAYYKHTASHYAF